MTLPINIKFKVLPRFPAQVIGREGIAVTKQNGIYYFDLQYADFPQVATLPAGVAPYNLVWDPVGDQFYLLSLSTSTWVDAPSDANTYGRHQLAWTQVLPMSGGTLTGNLILNGDPSIPLGAATKQYVDNSIISGVSGIYAPINSPTFTGVPAAPTATAGTNTTQLATTAFVQSAIGTPGVVPVNAQSANYTAVAADAGKAIYHPIADNNARTFTIPANASVAYTIGTVISFVNLINTVTIAITTDTMYLAGAGTTGSRTLAAYGCCTAMKVDTTTWIISGTGLT